MDKVDVDAIVELHEDQTMFVEMNDGEEFTVNFCRTKGGTITAHLFKSGAAYDKKHQCLKRKFKFQ